MALKTNKGTMTSGKVNHNGKVFPIKEMYVQKDGEKQLVFSGWYWNTGNTEWVFTGNTSYVNSIAVDSQGYVYSASHDFTVRKISPTGEEVWKFTGHTNSVRSVAVDSQGYVYSSSSDNTVRKISPTGEEVWKFTGHTNSVQSVAVDSQGYVYSSSSDNTVRKISPTGEEVWKLTHASHKPLVVVKHDYIYYLATQTTVAKIDNKGREQWVFTHSVGLNDLAITSSGDVFLANNRSELTWLNKNGEKNSEITVYKFLSHVETDKKNYIYVSDGDNNLKKINKRGEVLWATDATGKADVRSIAVDNFGKAYIGDSRGKVWKIG